MPNLKIYSFQKIFPVVDFLASTHDTQGTLQTVIWSWESIIFSIGHFEGPTEVELNS